MREVPVKSVPLTCDDFKVSGNDLPENCVSTQDG
jgi:hypothetical protein